MKKISFKRRKKRLPSSKNLETKRLDAIFSSSQAKQDINKWMQLRGWSFNEFPIVLKKLNLLETLVSIEEIAPCFYCVHLKNNEQKMLLDFDQAESAPTITIENCFMSKTYSINYNYNSAQLQLALIRKIINKYPKKRLTCFYSSIYHYSLITDDYTLDIEANGSISSEISEKIENYLLGLQLDDYIFDVSAVCMNIQNIIFNCMFTKSMFIMCSKNIPNHASRITSKIAFDAYGSLTEFTASKSDCEVFTVYRNGDWEWFSLIGGQKIYYSQKNDLYNYSLSGTPQNIVIFETPFETLNKVKSEIQKLQKIFEKKFF